MYSNSTNILYRNCALRCRKIEICITRSTEKKIQLLSYSYNFLIVLQFYTVTNIPSSTGDFTHNSWANRY